MSFWRGKKVLITGAAGLIGSHVVEELLRREPKVKITAADDFSRGRRENLRAVRSRIKILKTDLSDYKNAFKACAGQDIVLNLAARVGGVGYNVRHQGTMFRDNMCMFINILEAARRRKVERFLVVSSACVYSREPSIPTPESEGFCGSPERSSEGYGWAKRMSEFMAWGYHREFGMKIAIVRPYNAYGPRDHFGEEDSHVISALIRRVMSGENPLKVWGDGSHTRTFLFTEDFARGLLDVCERYAECDPVNLCSDEEISIKRLARMIVKLSGLKTRLEFDPSKPSGQPRRLGDSAKARKRVGFKTRVSLEEGLKRTIQWYRKNVRPGRPRGS